MAIKTLHIPGLGDFTYDDDSGAELFSTDGRLQVSTAPADPTDLLRLSDITGGTANPTFNNIEIDGALNHDGAAVGFYGTTPVAQASDIGALSDSSGGSTDGTIEAMPDPGDSPADADALRDDLVANTIPALRNNIAELTAQVNALRTILRNYGLMA